MFSYVFMKILEARPRSYDRRMDRLSGGRVSAIKVAVASQVSQGSRVVEIGCGTGELAQLLCERGVEVTAFDADPRMLDEARQRAASRGLDDCLTLLEMGVEGMDRLPAATFDAVVATLVLSELSDDERRYALRHAARILRQGGRLIIADEVEPRSTAARALHGLVRTTGLIGSTLLSGATTRPLCRLPEQLREQGFDIEDEQRSHGGAFAVVSARAATAVPKDDSTGVG